jgi:uncharacterized membrane protein YidH (DUF202 family)
VSRNKVLIESYPFSRVLAVELDAIRRRRRHLARSVDEAEVEAESNTTAETKVVPSNEAALQDIANQKAQRRNALDMHLVGLSISGGGIRSATFALGLLQGLAELDLLRRLDYISTVSGGGYIGGWLAAWTKREGDIANVYQQLRPDRDDQSLADRLPLPKGPNGVVDAEPEPIHHLRSYSRYLAPRSGFFSSDAWSLFVIYARNLLLNLLILLPATVVVVTLVRLLLLFFRAPNASFAKTLNLSELGLVLVVAAVWLTALSLAFNVIGMELWKMQCTRNRRRSIVKAPMKIESRLASLILAAVTLIFIGTVAWWNWRWVEDQLRRRWVVPLLSAIGVIFIFSGSYFPVVQIKLRAKPQPPITIHRLVS